MNFEHSFDQEKVLERLDRVEYWAKKMIFVLVIFAILLVMLNPSSAAYGQEEIPQTDEAANNLVGIFTDLGKLAIKVIYALVMIVFAVGTVKSGLGAQAAQAFGATGRVSLEMMNLVGGIVVFGIAIMTLPLANMIIDTVTQKLFESGFSVEINNPFAP